MTDDSKHHIELDGTLVAELLDQSEHPSNIGNVAAISDQQIVLLRRDKRELVNYRFEYFDVRDCRAIKISEGDGLLSNDRGGPPAFSLQHSSFSCCWLV